MTDRLKELKDSLFASIDSIESLSDMRSFLEQEIGIENDNVDFNILNRRVNQIMEECAETNNAKIIAQAIKFDSQFSTQEDMINGMIKSGLKGVKVNGGMILKARDIFFKTWKFKPWETIKLASKINKALAVLNILIDGYNLYKKWRDAKKLEECKKELKDVLNEYFKQIYALFDDNDTYYENFAPSYPEMVKAVETRKNEVQELATNVSMLKTYRSRIEEWFGSDIKDADFEEIE